MSPDNSLVERGERTYILAAGKREYVVYSVEGRNFTLELPNTTFTASWYDPRTGDTVFQSEIKGDGSTDFTKPSGEDWVLHLRRS